MFKGTLTKLTTTMISNNFEPFANSHENVSLICTVQSKSYTVDF